MKTKTFPLVFSIEEHTQIKLEATKQGISIKEFIMTAIEEKIKKEGE